MPHGERVGPKRRRRLESREPVRVPYPTLIRRLVQGSPDMIGTSEQSDNMITLQGQACNVDALACSTGLADPRPSRRGRGRRPTMGHGLQESRMHAATHWNDYDKSPLKHVIPHAIKDIMLNFEMEKDDKVGNDVCTKVILKGVRQQRYRLKKKYFNGYTAQEALSNKPANITHENWTSHVNKWSDERNKEICQMNKENREAVKHHQKTGSMSYVAFFSKLNAMEKKRETQSEVLKEESAHSTFLSSMGYASRSERSGSSTSSAQIRVLEERIEQKDREARDANDRHREELAAWLEAQERAFEEIQKKQQEELEALKKSQQEKNEACVKKQKETDNLLDFLLRAQATRQSQSKPDGS
uniref:Uncharacterized protein n=1 Tax=Aegilops tauschii TaxID=37682 RepID=M8BS75_AEGTA